MSAAHFFRLKKLKGRGIMLAAARHNRRTIQAELGADSHIDSTRSHLNETMRGPPSPDEVAQCAKEAMEAAGVGKLRKDAVVGLEAVFSLPLSHTIDQRKYFAKCVEWVGVQFGGADNIMSADMHLDETQPHVHVLMVPLVNGRMVGSDMVGNRSTLQALQSRFFEEVASQFGLRKPPARLMGEAKIEAAIRVIAAMKANSDPALRSAAWPVIRSVIESDPVPFMTTLGLEVASKGKRLRSSTAIFISKGKGPKTEPKHLNPIGFQASKNERTLSCVGFDPKPPPSIAPIEAPNTRHQGNKDDETQITVRVRDDDMPAESWDADTGTFRHQPQKQMTQKVAAREWVSAALGGRSCKSLLIESPETT